MNVVNSGISNFIKNCPDAEINVVEEMLSLLKNFKDIDVDDLIAYYVGDDDYLVLRLYKGKKEISVIKNLTVEEDDDGITDPIYQIIGWHEKTVKTCGDSDDIEYIVKVVTDFLKGEN